MTPQTNTQQPIDFSPLTRPVTATELAAYNEFRKKSSKSERVSLIIIVVIVMVGSLFLFPWPIVNKLQFNGISVLAALVTWLGLIVAVIYGISLMIKAYTKKIARLYTFAIRNNLTFIDSLADPGYAGMIFDEGHTRKISLGFVFPGRAEIGNYMYTTGSGKNSRDHRWGYIKTKLPRKLPHMVLDAKKNNIFGKFSNLTDTFDRSQSLPLEGDFNEHFTLYAPKQYERDALYIFTPDVMASLIDNGGGFDMEVVDDHLMIYKSGSFDLANEAEITKLLAIVSTIGTELREQTDRYADERVASPAQNIVAPQGARLKRGVSWVVIAFFVIFAWQIIVPFIQVIFLNHN